MATLTTSRISRFDPNTAVADRPNLKYHPAERTYLNGSSKFTGLTENQRLEMLDLYNDGKHENGKRYTLTDLELKFKVSKSYINKQLRSLQEEGFEVKRRSAGVARKTKNLPVLYNRPAITSSKKSLVGFISLPVVTYRPTPSLDEVFGEGAGVAYETNVKLSSKVVPISTNRVVESWDEKQRPVYAKNTNAPVLGYNNKGEALYTEAAVKAASLEKMVFDNSPIVGQGLTEQVVAEERANRAMGSTIIDAPAVPVSPGFNYGIPAHRTKEQRVSDRTKFVGKLIGAALGTAVISLSTLLPLTYGAIKVLSDKPQTPMIDNYYVQGKKETKSIAHKEITNSNLSEEEKTRGAAVVISSEEH